MGCSKLAALIQHTGSWSRQLSVDSRQGWSQDKVQGMQGCVVRRCLRHANQSYAEILHVQCDKGSNEKQCRHQILATVQRTWVLRTYWLMSKNIFFLENNLTIPYKIKDANSFCFCETTSCYVVLADLWISIYHDFDGFTMSHFRLKHSSKYWCDSIL